MNGSPAQPLRLYEQLRREADAAHEVGEARVGSQRVKVWVSPQILQLKVVCGVCLLQRSKRPLPLTQIGVKVRQLFG
jgi:hypothetical protein